MELIDATADKNCVAVINKNDLETKIDESIIEGRYKKVVKISAKNGEGAELLSGAIKDALERYKLGSDAQILVNERQYDCACRAKKEVDTALLELKSGQHPDMLGILLEEAVRALGELSGESANDAVVNEIFSKFCVGK